VKDITSDNDLVTVEHSNPRGGLQIRVLATVTAILVYLQIVLGALLRHMPVDAEPTAFMFAVKFHLFLAAVLTLHIGLLVFTVLRSGRAIRPLRSLAFALITSVALQLVLGAATWIVKFSVPDFARDWVSQSSVAVQDGGWLQTLTITAHVATGSLLLATSVSLALYSHRLLRTTASHHAGVGRGRLEAAV